MLHPDAEVVIKMRAQTGRELTVRGSLREHSEDRPDEGVIFVLGCSRGHSTNRIPLHETRPQFREECFARAGSTVI